MIMTTTTILNRLSPLILRCAAALILMGCGSPLHAQTVAVMVNGEPITNYDIDQRSKLNFLTTHKPAVRQQVINELIDEKVKIKEGKKFGVDPTASDIDQSFAAMSSRMRTTPEALAKSLESQGVRPETLKARMKAEMVWTSLVRGRYKESLQVGEKDVAAAVLRLLQNKHTQGQVYTISDRPTTVREYVDTCIRQSRSQNIRVLYVPYFVTRLGGWMATLVQKLTHLGPRINRRRLLSLYRDVGVNSALLRQHTGWQPAGALLERVSDPSLKGLGFQEAGS
jgi:hypothetical protein